MFGRFSFTKGRLKEGIFPLGVCVCVCLSVVIGWFVDFDTTSQNDYGHYTETTKG